MSREAIAFLAGSPDRRFLLDHLADRPSSPRDVADGLDVSTRSAQRNLSALADRGWAEKADGQYRLTTVGHLVLDAYADCLSAFDAVDEYRAFYGHLPGPENAPDPAWLADATYVTASADHPQEPVDHYVDAVESLETDHVRMLAPVLSRLFHEPHAKQVLRGASTELVLPGERVDAASDLNPTEFRVVLALPQFTLYRHEGDVGFGLTVTDDRAFVLAYDDGQLRACVDGADPALREWAIDRYEAFRDDASAVEGPSGPL